MINLTHNNHLKYYINEQEFGIRQNPFDRYRVTVGQIDHERYVNSTFYEELKRIAKLICLELGQDFEIYFSGGTDCEILIRCFLAIGVKPKLVTIKYTDNSNEYEVLNAVKIANRLSLSLEIVNFDVKDFYYSGAAINMAQKIYCAMLIFNVFFENVRRRNIPAIMGGNVPLTKKIGNFDPYWYYTYMESEETCNIRFNQEFNIPVIYEFFSYTPEAMLYWLDSTGVKNLVNSKNFKLKVESSKNQILIDELPELRIEHRVKTHGWEKTVPFSHEANRHIVKHLVPRLTNCLDGIKYNDIITQLRGHDETNT